MTPQERADLMAKEGPGRVTVQQCFVCGYYEWVATQRGVPDEIVVELLGPEGSAFSRGWQCRRCLEVATRAPEVYRWVMAVMRRHVQQERQEP